MLPQYTTAQLIPNIKRRCSVPSTQLTYDDQDFCDLATDEMQGEVVPLIMSTREEYFVSFIDVATPDTRRLPIPDVAVGAKLRTVAYVQQANPLVLVNLPRIDLDLIAGVGYVNYQTLAGFYVENNDLVLYPNTSVPVGTQIRLYYYKRTLALVPPSDYGRVVAVDELNSTIQLSFVPPDWTTGMQLNGVVSTSPFDVTSTPTIVMTSAPNIVLDTVEGIAVGDYMSVLGFSAIPQIPVEAHAYLAQLTGVKALEGLGDTKNMEIAQGKADLLKKNLLIMISQRVDGSVKKIISPSGGLRMNNGLWRGGRGYGQF